MASRPREQDLETEQPSARELATDTLHQKQEAATEMLLQTQEDPSKGATPMTISQPSTPEKPAAPSIEKIPEPEAQKKERWHLEDRVVQDAEAFEEQMEYQGEVHSFF